MQTFLTHDNYLDTAKILDYKRLGKQRVEAYQIFKALRGDYHRSKGWINHPATAMWRGFEYQLALYGLTISQEFLDRGYNGQRMVEIFTQLATQAFAQDKQNPPWWVQSKLLQKTHQSNLLRKDFGYYSKHFSGTDNLPYVWPLCDQNTYRLGTFTERNTISMAMINGQVYLTSIQVAELCGVSKNTISAYKARGQMPPPDKEFGRTPMWSIKTIEAWRGQLGGLPRPDFTKKDKPSKTEG